MKPPLTELPGWTRKRFWGVVSALFIAQAGLILLFAERGPGGSHTVPAPVHFRLVQTPMSADQLTSTFFAIDPTVFALANVHGFSERAWLRLPGLDLDAPGETDAPAWLQVDSSRLGTNFSQVARMESPLPFGLPDNTDEELEPWPVTLVPDTIQTRSSFKIRDKLARRQLASPYLRNWASAQLLSNSVVQIAVDSAGQVVAAHLLGRSGLVDADTNALDEARRLRFRPAPPAAPVWGRAIFAWQTIEATNVSVPALPVKP